MKSNLFNTRHITYISILLASVLFFFTTSFTHAAVTCDFTRDLEIGIDGEDVRCLQQYLNDTGFPVAETGVGSPGQETSLFRDRTKDAVVRWQQANAISPTSGYFGSQSRATYDTLIATSNQVSPTPTVLGVSTETPTKSTMTKDELLSLTRQLTVTTIERTVEVLEKERDHADIGRANLAFYDAIRAFIADDFLEVSKYTQEVNKILQGTTNTKNTRDETNDDDSDRTQNDDDRDSDRVPNNDDRDSNTTFREADSLNEAETALDDAWRYLRELRDDDIDVDDARELLNETRGVLSDIKNTDEDETDELDDLLTEFNELVEDAYEELDEAKDDDRNRDDDDEDEAEEELEDAENELEELEELIDEARDDDEDTDEAEDLLEEAEDLLEDAEDAFANEDYDEVLDIVDEIMDLIEEAEDEL